MKPVNSFPLIVEAHREAWAEEFERESARVREAMGAVLRALHHIGSTAVPGLHAKPIIDMLAEVDSLVALDARGDAMAALGYEAMGEFGISGRRYFRKCDGSGARTHHIHAFADGSRHVARHLAFRDYLRAHPAAAAEYGALKLRLVSTCAGDMEAYIAGKDASVERFEREALDWHAAASEEE